jgi:hypothetical protein
MARAPSFTPTMTEDAIGILLLCVVGWFVAKSFQTQVPNAPTLQTQIPQSGLTQAYGTQYIWPGSFTGTPSINGNVSATAPALTPLTIPPFSPITYPPISQPFTPSAASGASNTAVSCGCSTGGGF